MPTSSVLINNYNNGRYLRRCLESVLAQSVPPGEVIVYDDGSTDESLAVLRDYEPRVNILRGERGRGTPMHNQARAIEAAFQVSSGEVCFLLDGDDAFAPGKMAAYLAAFTKDERTVMVQAPLWKIDAAGRMLGVEYDPRRHADDYVRSINETQDVNIFYPTSAQAFRRNYLGQRLPLDDEDGLQLWPDARLTLIAPHFGRVVTLAEPYTFWRRHPQSHTVVTKTSVLENVRRNRTYYNAFCARHGLPTVSAWRSGRQVKRWVRHLCPDLVIETLHRLRPRRAQLLRTLPPEETPSSGRPS